MRYSSLLLLVLGGLCGWLGFHFLRPTQAENQENPALATEVLELQQQLAVIQQSMDSLQQRLDAMPTSASTPVERSLDPAMIEQMVAEALAAQAPTANNQAEDASQAAQKKADAEALLNQSIGQLLAGNLPEEEREALWESLKEQGLLEEAITRLEAEVEANPNNLNLMNQLAYAYLQPIIRGGVVGMEAGQWSVKADQTYDRVLEADPQNWEARFSKAVSYSFWPPMFGKQPEAIRHFEILVDQQSHQPAQPQFAQTHLLLGNLYEQSGNHERAVQAWQQGLQQFPDNPELRKQLGLE